MLKEYALDPACLGEWSTFRYLIENFGVSQGRLISEFPSKWLRMVYSSCGKFSFQQKQKLQIELKRIRKHGLCVSSRSYDGNLEWLPNALSQQKVSPFHAIISSTNNPDPHVLNAEDLNHTDPLWKVEREVKVFRNTEGLTSVAAKLLQVSDQIFFVDKFFDPEIPKWRDLFLHLMHTASEGRNAHPLFEYHTKIDNDEFGKTKEQREKDFKALCEHELRGKMPAGCQLKIFRWDQKHKGDFFHSRYILTEKGGMRIDWGLDTGKIGEMTDVSLMDDTLWAEYRSWFQEKSTVMDLVDCTVVKALA